MKSSKIKAKIHFDRFPSGEDLDDYKIVIIRSLTGSKPLRVLETSHDVVEEFNCAKEFLDFISTLQVVVTDKNLLQKKKTLQSMTIWLL